MTADLEKQFAADFDSEQEAATYIRVATSAGFLVEGLERQKLKYGDERFDVELHSRLATDPEPANTTIFPMAQATEHPPCLIIAKPLV
jgi:hypothetical protein